MIKYSIASKPDSSRKIHIPLKSLLFWHKKIEGYINKKKQDNVENFEYPTIYISKKYPKMSILELSKRIKNHIRKHFPDVYNILNKKEKEEKEEKPKESLNKENKENKEVVKKEEIIQIEEDDDEDIYKNTYRGIELSNEIKKINEMNCSHINDLFKSYKFEDKIAEKYDNSFVKIIICNKDNSDSSINKKDDSSTTSISSISTSSNKNKKNKINFVTHLQNKQLKPKLFNIYSL